MFVSSIDPERNTVTLVEDEKLLYRQEVIAGDLRFTSLPREALETLTPVTARIRYSQGMAEGETILLGDGKLRVWFREPQRAVTPGQALVVYTGDVVACGGRILG